MAAKAAEEAFGAGCLKLQGPHRIIMTESGRCFLDGRALSVLQGIRGDLMFVVTGCKIRRPMMNALFSDSGTGRFVLVVCCTVSSVTHKEMEERICQHEIMYWRINGL